MNNVCNYVCMYAAPKKLLSIIVEYYSSNAKKIPKKASI